MKYIKVFEDEKVLKDMQGLGLAKILYGWWVTAVIGGYVNYYIIYDTNKEDAIYELALELTGFESDDLEFEEIADAKKFSDLENEIADFMQDGDSMNITAWEMTPVTKDISKKMLLRVANAYNIGYAYRQGKEHFSDFEMVMNKNLEGTE